MTIKRIHQWVNTQQTIGAVTASFTEASPVATPTDSTVSARVELIGRVATTKLCVRIVLEGAFKNVSGTVSLQGALATQVLLGDASLTGCIGTIDVSGAALVPKVTGIALLTIDWMCHTEWKAYAP